MSLKNNSTDKSDPWPDDYKALQKLLDKMTKESEEKDPYHTVETASLILDEILLEDILKTHTVKLLD